MGRGVRVVVCWPGVGSELGGAWVLAWGREEYAPAVNGWTGMVTFELPRTEGAHEEDGSSKDEVKPGEAEREGVAGGEAGVLEASP
jgi:hypothetical protein